MSQNKNEVLYRVYIVLGLLVIFAGFIFYNAVKINVLEGEKWRNEGEKDHFQNHVVKASRGNIMTEDGALLASSLPFFDIYFDSTIPSEELWANNLDSLVVGLMPFLVDDFNMTDYAFRTFYRDSLIRARNASQKYMRIKKGVSYADYETMKQLPIFRRGQMRGGFIAEEDFKRERPYGMLARRTLGYVLNDRKVGLEGFFDKALKGSDGKKLKVYQAASRILVPVDNLNSIKPKSGDDIVTTLDVNIQDVVQKALLRGMEHHDAQTGTVIVMEVKTGKIKAISNVGKTTTGWYEDYNYAVGTKVEPGSTFKLASMMALLEDGYIDLDDSIDLEQGLHTFYEEEMRDASFHQLDTTTIRKAFEISSNVGIAKLVQKYYGNTDAAAKFIQHLRNFRLDQLVGIEINGEDEPYVKEAYNSDDDWSGISLPWMSIGYEVELTPLQLLTFYNAVANDGRMMKPYLVTQVQHFGDPLKNFKPTVIKKQIAKPETIQKVKELLEGVVETGTAKKLKSNRYKFAGKTGTAQINYYKFDQRDNIKYRASFAGYFPAEDPVYSCIVVITEPRQNGRYGSEVAGPIFRQIADKCFIQQKDLYPKENEQVEKLTKKQLPQLDVGYRKDVDKVLKKLNLKHTDSGVKNWAVLTADTDTLHIAPRYISRDLVPNVVGMGLRDALYVLENLGLKVTFEGAGKVVQQSLKGGTKIRGQKINLKLK
ncbi:MAG: penicillin-binding protein [Saprospiraceae bacterium]